MIRLLRQEQLEFFLQNKNKFNLKLMKRNTEK